jgi:hypothetical protein
MAKERVIPLERLQQMLDSLQDAIECGNRALVRSRIGEFIADELGNDRQRSGGDVTVRTKA